RGATREGEMHQREIRGGCQQGQSCVVRAFGALVVAALIVALSACGGDNGTKPTTTAAAAAPPNSSVPVHNPHVPINKPHPGAPRTGAPFASSTPPAAQGVADAAAGCRLGTQCVSGNCIDGVCCATASCPPGQFCNLDGHVGECAAAPPAATPT